MMKKVIALVKPFRKKERKVVKVIVINLTNSWLKIEVLLKYLPSAEPPLFH